MLHNCRVVAIEGTHASGKTTLVHALTAHYRSRGVLVTCTDEPARTSPFVEDVVLHGRRDFDVELEVDLFAAQLAMQLRASRHHDLLICDKTIMNVAAYARLVLDLPKDIRARRACDAIDAFCAAWSHTYDAVLYCPDCYRSNDGVDRFRSKVLDRQDQVAVAVRRACRQAGTTLLDIPHGLSVAERVQAATEHIDPLLRPRESSR